MSAISPADRPALVRAALSRMGVDGLILPRGDEFLGEYVAPYAERLAWLTGFTGSSGLAVLLSDNAAVFSDGRYTSQLEDQVDPALWERLHLVKDPPAQWLRKKARGLRVGYDPKLVSETGLQALKQDNYTLVPLLANPIDEVWVDQPSPPESAVSYQDERFSGESSRSKRQRIAETLRAQDEQALIVSDPTALAWLLNIRGNDVPHTPVALAFGILHDDAQAEIFIDSRRLAADVVASFGTEVTVRPVAALADVLHGFSGKTVRLDTNSTALWFLTTLQDSGALVSRGSDPCVLPKACKNPVEQQGSRDVHLVDSASLCRFLFFTTKHGVGLRETELAEKLHHIRAEALDYREESFPAISAAGPNAALPHYRALPGKDRVLEHNQIYLIDSGGQYPAGTTDVTRTIWTGPDAPPDDVRAAFTRVLKGNILLARARFPNGTTGHRLDALARYALWQDGLDYDHGTGHGIGSYLSVHEGPQNISSAPRPTTLQPGMIVSDEPGYYAPGRYGIRLENLLLVRESEVGNGFLEFEVLNFAPFDTTLIDASLLNEDERAWLDAYHAQVLAKIGPSLDADTRAWLTQACEPLVTN